MTLTQLKDKLGLGTISENIGLVEKGYELLCVLKDQTGLNQKPRLVETYVGEYCLFRDPCFGDTILYQLACPPKLRTHFVQVSARDPSQLLTVALLLPDGQAIHYEAETGKVIRRDLEKGTQITVLSFPPGQSCNIDSGGIHQHIYDRVTGLPYDKVYSFDGIYQEEASAKTLRRSIAEALALMVRGKKYDPIIKEIVERYVGAWPLSFEVVDDLVGELQLHGLAGEPGFQRYHRLRTILTNAGLSSDADAATNIAVCIGAYNHRKSEMRKSACPSDHFLSLLENYQKQNTDIFFDQLQSAATLYKAIHAYPMRR